jgi:hypothetical protein
VWSRQLRSRVLVYEITEVRRFARDTRSCVRFTPYASAYLVETNIGFDIGLSPGYVDFTVAKFGRLCSSYRSRRTAKEHEYAITR